MKQQGINFQLCKQEKKRKEKWKLVVFLISFSLDWSYTWGFHGATVSYLSIIVS